MTLFDAAGDEVDSTTWQGHSPTTWGRIPDMTGDFAVTGEPTRTGRNTPAEPVDPVETSPWPFDPMTITPVALDGPFTGDDMSGVDIADDGTAYVVNNGAGTLHVLSYDQPAPVWRPARPTGFVCCGPTTPPPMVSACARPSPQRVAARGTTTTVLLPDSASCSVLWVAHSARSRWR